MEAADPDGGQRVGVAVRRGMLLLVVGRRDMLPVVVVVVGRRGAAAADGGPGREVLRHGSRVGVERDAGEKDKRRPRPRSGSFLPFGDRDEEWE